jgi:hypothetical protein
MTRFSSYIFSTQSGAAPYTLDQAFVTKGIDVLWSGQKKNYTTFVALEPFL